MTTTDRIEGSDGRPEAPPESPDGDEARQGPAAGVEDPGEGSAAGGTGAAPVDDDDDDQDDRLPPPAGSDGGSEPSDNGDGEPAGSDGGSEPSDNGDGEPAGDGDDGLELDDVDIRDLLRGALKPPSSPDEQKVLSQVQRQIRAETAGRYFADGWSTSESPKATYLITSLVMLAVIIALYILLSPYGIEVLP